MVKRLSHWQRIYSRSSRLSYWFHFCLGNNLDWLQMARLFRRPYDVSSSQKFNANVAMPRLCSTGTREHAFSLHNWSSLFMSFKTYFTALISVICRLGAGSWRIWFESKAVRRFDNQSWIDSYSTNDLQAGWGSSFNKSGLSVFSHSFSFSYFLSPQFDKWLTIFSRPGLACPN